MLICYSSTRRFYFISNISSLSCAIFTRGHCGAEPCMFACVCTSQHTHTRPVWISLTGRLIRTIIRLLTPLQATNCHGNSAGASSKRSMATEISKHVRTCTLNKTSNWNNTHTHPLTPWPSTYIVGKSCDWEGTGNKAIEHPEWTFERQYFEEEK